MIPLASQIGIVDGAASLTDGFPPLTRTLKAAGGVPPSGLDMNGVLYLISAGLWWMQAGGWSKFDSAYSTAVGGYPNGAVLQSADNAGWWRSTVDNNTSDPDAGGANWTPHFAYGSTPITMASSNVTLTAAQALKPLLVLTGTLGANVNLVLPAMLQQWLIVNNTTGNFTITAKTLAGTGVVLGAGPNHVYGDGTNVGLVVNTLAFDVPVSGTFTPAVAFGGAASGLTYSTRTGRYIKTGKKVDFWIFMALSAKGSSTGPATFSLGALPAADGNFPCQMSVDLMGSLVGHPSGMVIASTSGGEFRVFNASSGSEAGSLTHADFTNTSAIYISGTYLTA